MGAVQDFISYLRKLLSALRIPFHRSIKLILRLWSLFRTWFLFGGAKRKGFKPSRGISNCDQGPSGIMYASQAPSQLSPIIAGDTPNIDSVFSPIPIRVHRSTYDRLMYPHAPGSSQYEFGEEDGSIGDNAHGYFPDGPQPPACASPVPASRHLAPDDAILPDSIKFNPVIGPSRSPSPASQRSRYQNSHNGAEEFALQQLQPSVYFPSSSRPPSRADNIEVPPRASSMIDLNSRRSRAITRATPRGRSSSARPTSRARSRTPMSGHLRRGPSPAHIHADPTCRSSRPPSTRPPSTRPFSTMDTAQIKPCANVARYDRAITISRENDVQHTLPSMTVTFSYENMPSGWKPLAHPEGALYWVHEQRPIYTDAYLCDAVALGKINKFLSAIDLLIEGDNIQLPSDWELVLELSPEQEEEEIWSYYFIDHEHRSLFWLHPFDLGELLQEVATVKSKAHIHHQIQYYYWQHWETFPHNREIPREVIDELTGILVHAGIDCLTSPSTTSIYSEGELTKFLRFVESLKSVTGNNGYAACVVGRLMSFYANSRFVNFYGQNCARLSRNQSIYDNGSIYRSSLMFLSPFLFFAPEVHLKGLEDIYTDRVICNHRWTSFIGKLQGEWQEFILYATVLLNGNVGFLAIPSVSNGTDQRTAPQIISYMSVVCSAGSIITGLLLIRQYRTKRESFEGIDWYLQDHQNRGFATLAILYSLPYSLLMWAIITFLVAFTTECLGRTAGMLPRIPLIIAWVAVGVLVVWCISANWEWDDPPRFMGLMDAIRTPLFGKPKEESSAEKPDTKVKRAWLQRVLSRRFTQTSTLVGSPTEDSNMACRNSV